MNKKGFTLVELLAVIVILAIILAIAVPAISSILSNSTKSAFESDAKMVIQAAKYKQLGDSTFDPLTVTKDNIKDKLGLSGDNYQQLNFEIVDNKLKVTIVGVGKWNGFTAYGTSENMTVVNSSDYDVSPPVITITGDNPDNVYQDSVFTDSGVSATDLHDGSVAITSTIKNNSGTVVPSIDTSSLTTYTITYTAKDSAGNVATPVVKTINIVKLGNAPVLATGMTPIKWDGSSWVDTTSADIDWYSYKTTDKKWANARTADGSMWVWIPRYIYKISSGWHSNTAGAIDIQFTKGIDDNWNSSAIGNINTDTTAESSHNTWTNHPAFTFGSTQLTGIWVAKFEASNDGSSNVKIIPNVSSWRSISENDIFNKVRSMETNSVYGWGTTGSGIDTHMMKNTEWGVVAYLSKSVYGKNDEIWINNSNTFTTGCAGDSASDAASTTGCEYTYNTTNGLQASTTSNIYGIYDMSGGAWEYTAAYVNNGHTNLTTYGNSIINSDSKYKDIYTMGSTDNESANYGLAINHKGDAVYETSSSSVGNTSWYSDSSYMTRTDSPWFVRGGNYADGSRVRTFSFNRTNGSAIADGGFRGVVLVGAGL